MSLAGQISDTVSVLAATRDARREALGRIRKDTSRHLSEARAAHRRMATAQQQQLTEALRSIQLNTAILLGAADEQIEAVRKARLESAAQLNRTLAEGRDALRDNTRKWVSAQSALRSKEAAEDLRSRRSDRRALAVSVQELTAGNVAFLAALTQDRQEASAIWYGRSTPKPVAQPVVAPVKAEPAPAVKAEPVKVEPVAVKPEPVKAEAPKVEPAKAEPVKAEASAAEKVEAKSESKAASGKGSEKVGSGKSA